MATLWYLAILLTGWVQKSFGDSAVATLPPEFLSDLDIWNGTHFQMDVARDKGRRLFGFEIPTSLDDLKSQAMNMVTEATAKVTGVTDLQEVLGIFKDSQTFITKGQEVALAAWTSFTKVGVWLTELFSSFLPLKPIFESSSGLLTLVTSRQHVHELIEFVKKLFDGSGILKLLSDACHVVTDIFSQISTLFTSALSKLSVRRLRGEDGAAVRRLFDYKSLLDGIDFEGLIKEMRVYIEKFANEALRLGEVKDVLMPLLAKLDAKMSGRRLDMSADQEKYEEAIKKIVPSWKSIEGGGISMCPKVLDAKGQVGSFKCRVDGFVNGGGALATLTSLVGAGGAGGTCPDAKSVAASEGASCPAASKSEGVKDMLSENAGALSWLLVVGGGLLACCGGGAAVAAKAVTGRGLDLEEGTELMSGSMEDSEEDASEVLE